jgi:hypothetical protein
VADGLSDDEGAAEADDRGTVGTRVTLADADADGSAAAAG